MNCQARACILPLLALSFLVFSQSCGLKRTMSFSSPSKGMAVEVWQTPVDNSWHMQLDLTTQKGRLVLYESPNEAFAHFVHVYWSPDEARVGILITGSGLWELAYNTRSGAEIPFIDVREALANSIARTYHLTRQKDPLEWAGSTEAHARFFQLHPEIHVSYGPNQ